MDFSLIGEKLPAVEAENLRVRLMKQAEIHRITERMPGIPIACQINATETSDHIELAWFGGEETVIAFFENDNVMVRATVSFLLDFLAQREPWQDWDVCIFDCDVTWCAALTHNDEAKFVRFA